MGRKVMKKLFLSVTLIAVLAFSVFAFSACGGGIDSARAAFEAAEGWEIEELFDDEDDEYDDEFDFGNIAGIVDGFYAFQTDGDGVFNIMVFESTELARAFYTISSIATPAGFTMRRRGNTIWGGNEAGLAVWNG